MKRFVLIMLSIFTCAIANAEQITINWLNEDKTTNQTTSCTIGGDVILPYTPTKYGYTFQGWIANYIPIEYLESTGTQWIDTGFYPNNNSSMEIKFVAYITESNVQGAWGIWNSSGSQTIIYYPSFSYKAFSINTTTPNTVILAPNRVTVNQTLSEHARVIFQYKLNSVGLFTAFENDSHLDYCAGKIYYAKFYNEDILVRDFIPVLDLHGTPCMYDKVTRQFFYNQGTGNFIAGPIINE